MTEYNRNMSHIIHLQYLLLMYRSQQNVLRIVAIGGFNKLYEL